MEMPTGSPYWSPTLGVDKTGVVRDCLNKGLTVAFAGDGFPDAEPARLVPADLRFARGDLADVLRGEQSAVSLRSIRGPTLPVACCSGEPDMLRPTQISIPTLVRVKDGALDRLGIYLGRDGRRAVAVLVSKGLPSPIPDRVARSLKEAGVEPVAWIEVSDNDIESSARLFAELPGNVSAVVGRWRRQGARRGEIRRVPGTAAVLRGADVAVERRLLQSAVEPDDPRQTPFASGRSAVRSRSSTRPCAWMRRAS